MKTIVISNGHILVDDNIYVPLDWEAFAIDGQIGIRHLSNPDIHLFKGRVAHADISLNGDVYATAIEFVYAFNSLTAAALSYLLPSMKANTDYPDTTLSVVLTPNIKAQITEHAKPGYAVIYNPGANTGVIYVGGSGVAVGSYAIEPGKSFPIESSDLSIWYVKNQVAGEQVFIGGSYKA
jgi:hypothetical protein